MKSQSKSPSSSLIEQVSWHGPLVLETTDCWVKAALGLDVTVLITVDVRVDLRVDVRLGVRVDVRLGVRVDVRADVRVDVRVDVDVAGTVVTEGSSQDTLHCIPSSKKLGSWQTAVQPSLEAVTVCLLARTGSSACLVALAEHTRLTRPKTTDGVARILLTEVRWMNAKKNVQRV